MKRLKELVKVAEGQGWVVERTKKNHFKFIPPEGRFIIVSGTPSDYYGFKNAEKQLKASGLTI